MKKQLALFSLMLLTFNNYAQTTWNTTLNSGTSAPKFGLSTNHPLKFYTNNALRITLTGAGRFGIGTADPTSELHVVGVGLFTSDVLTNSSLIIKNNFHIDHTPATPTSPNIISYRAGAGSSPGVVVPYTSPYLFRSLCDVNFPHTPPNSPEGPLTNNRIAYGAQTANLFSDVIQISDPGQNAALSFAVMNGDGIIALEPLNGYAGVGGSRALKINPGCPVDVRICEGGGRTSIFNGADIRMGLKVFEYGIQNTVTLGGDDAFTIFCRENNPNSPEINFRIYGNGKTFMGGPLGIGVQPAVSTLLNVYDPIGTQVSNLFTLGSAINPNVLNISSDGITLLKATASSGSVFKVKNQSTDIFAVRYDGVAFAREVVVTLAAFPDYVFSKEYNLLSLDEVNKYIKKNHRLPKMPSAVDIEKNGAAIGEIQRLTVEKVEELYLYIIQLEEKVELLSTNLKTLNNRK